MSGVAVPPSIPLGNGIVETLRCVVERGDGWDWDEWVGEVEDCCELRFFERVEFLLEELDLLPGLLDRLFRFMLCRSGIYICRKGGIIGV